MQRITISLSGFFLTAALFGAGVQVSSAQTTPKKAHTKTKSKTAATTVKYKAKCGMVYSAADAKKNHYVCPMDHKPLVKMTSAKK